MGDGTEWTVGLAGALVSIFRDGVEPRAVSAKEDGDLDKVIGIVGMPLDGVSFAVVVGIDGDKMDWLAGGGAYGAALGFNEKKLGIVFEERTLSLLLIVAEDESFVAGGPPNINLGLSVREVRAVRG